MEHRAHSGRATAAHSGRVRSTPAAKLTAVHSSGAARLLADEPRNYLTFRLGEAHFGIGIYNVRELVGGLEIARTGNIDPRLCGTIKLRTRTVPVMDLRERFKLAPKAAPSAHVVIVVQPEHPEESTLGLLVDELLDVKTIARKQIAPEAPPSIDSGFVIGCARIDDDRVYLLALERVLGIARD